MAQEYFLISKDTLELYKPEEYSKLLYRVQDSWTVREQVCIALIDFEKFENWYNKLTPAELTYHSIWCQQITDCVKDLSETKEFLSTNIFYWIYFNYNLSNNSNTCAFIGGMCKAVNMKPIDFFNYLKETQNHE